MASGVALLIVVAIVVYNLLAYRFLAEFIPVTDRSPSTMTSSQIAGALTAAQVTTACGISLLVQMLAPTQSTIRIAAQVLSARRHQARIGEAVPYLGLLTLAAGSLSIGADGYIAVLLQSAPSVVVTLVFVNIATAYGVSLISEVVRSVGSLLGLGSAPKQLAAVFLSVTVTCWTIVDTTLQSQAGKSPRVMAWVETVTVGRGVGNAWATPFAVLSAAAVLGMLVLVRAVQREEVLAVPVRIVSFRGVPRPLRALGRELAVAIRQPLGQVSLITAMVCVVLLGIAWRLGSLPQPLALIVLAVLSAAPLELIWGRTAGYIWMLREHRVRPLSLVSLQCLGGLVMAVMLNGLFFAVIAELPPPADAFRHGLTVLLAGSIAFLAGVLLPATSDAVTLVAATSSVAIVIESLALWGADQLFEFGMFGGALGVVVGAALALAAALIRVRHVLRPS